MGTNPQYGTKYNNVYRYDKYSNYRFREKINDKQILKELKKKNINLLIVDIFSGLDKMINIIKESAKTINIFVESTQI